MKRRAFMQSSALLLAASAAKGATAQSFPAKSAAQTEENTEVLVVGAGPSGIPAAVAAARTGARVILAEEDFVPGGAPVDMYVSMICGGPQVGIFREMCERLNRQFDLNGEVRQPRTDNHRQAYFFPSANYWYLPSAFINVNYALMSAEKNLDFRPGMQAVGVLTEDGNRTKVTGVIFQGAGNVKHVIKAKVVVDATGTGLIAALAGCETMYGRTAKADFGEEWALDKADERVQRITWMYISQRIKPGAVLDVKKLKGTGLIENNINKWVSKGEPDYYERNTGVYLHWGSTVECKDTRDPAAIGEAQKQAFEVIRHDMDYMASVGFAMHLAPKIGVREVRRVTGDYVLTVEDLRKGWKPDDIIAYSDYGVDAWGTTLPKDRHIPRYGIPYRSLLPKNTEGLLIAGKAISTTHLAMSAIRVQPIVASIGTAAGVAAAMTAQNGTTTRNVDVGQLQKSLFAIGTLFKS